MSHSPHIFVKCWNCKKDFDITEAEHCYEHLENGHWTTKCSHCGACVCGKVYKMVPTDCKVLNSHGIFTVMPSLAKQLKNSRSIKETKKV